MAKLYQIIKVTGFGVMEAPYNDYPTEHIFRKKRDAENKANELLFETTTEEERNSGWCPIHYRVDIVKIK